ncbi:hypothetical protein BVRB_008760 [Beta vulgaris subsp. vulgaris]|uniref:NERD domain-containing protein n=1 Tax=Beta vulgaris subsp. vulgaris TaxID=3555 RepID=A0A0J8B670_BETVV|nr:hypothetical protein BVRB_008760 [Beta vulgaris subsp. vulgaris]
MHEFNRKHTNLHNTSGDHLVVSPDIVHLLTLTPFSGVTTLNFLGRNVI